MTYVKKDNGGGRGVIYRHYLVIQVNRTDTYQIITQFQNNNLGTRRRQTLRGQRHSILKHLLLVCGTRLEVPCVKKIDLVMASKEQNINHHF